MIVVPGAGITEACTANLNSLRRVLLAVRLHRQGRAPAILFTGGVPEGSQCSVAGVMEALAREIGIPATSMHVEALSRSTWQNAEMSTPVLHALGARRLLLVTDRLHMARAQACFARFGFEIERGSVPVYEGARDNVEMLYWGLREYLAIWYYRLRGRIGGGSVAGAGAPISPQRPIASAARHGPRHAMNAPVRYPEGPLVILGASYAAGWKLHDISGVAVVNKGIPGQQSHELLARFESDVVSLRPRAVLIWGFINDVHRAPREQITAAVERAHRSFEQMVVLARTSGIEPIIATEVTIRQPKTLAADLQMFLGRLLGRTSYQGYINRHVLETNAWLRDLADRQRIRLLDLQPMLADASNSRRRAYATDDGSHIPEPGYAALTQYARPILEAWLKLQ